LVSVNSAHAEPDLTLVNLLLDYGADTNTLSSSGESPLYVTCSKVLMAVVQKMLNCGAKVNVSKGQKSPLIAACRKRHTSIVELLLREGADPNVPEDVAGRRSFALNIALELVSVNFAHAEPDSTLVNLLLDYGADTNTLSSSGESPFYVACSKGLTTVVERMLKCGAKVNVSMGQKSPLIAACENKQHPEIVELLLKEGADPNVPEDVADGRSFALHVALKFALVPLLLMSLRLIQ